MLQKLFNFQTVKLTNYCVQTPAASRRLDIKKPASGGKKYIVPKYFISNTTKIVFAFSCTV